MRCSVCGDANATDQRLVNHPASSFEAVVEEVLKPLPIALREARVTKPFRRKRRRSERMMKLVSQKSYLLGWRTALSRNST
jgi:hypothetical protein